MPKKKAFTLVELLVVIAIIALLISILAPSLQNARLMARQMMCGQNLRSIGSAIQTYAAANRDYVPPFANSQAKRDEVLKPTSPGALPVAYREGEVDTYGENAPHNLAFLHNEYSSSDRPSMLYVEDWRMFYCPAQPRVKPKPGGGVHGYWASFYEEYLEMLRWKDQGVVRDALGKSVLTSYTYNPNITPEGKHRYPKIDHFPAESVLAMDLVFSEAKFVAHWISAPSWNVCFADSHVENVLSQQAEALFETGVGDVSGNTEAFLNFMNVIVYGN